jgi:polyisoprenoid-binding protein YceI
MRSKSFVRSFLILCALLVSFGALNAAFAGEPEPKAAAATEVEQYVRFVIDHADSSKGLVKGSFDKFTVKKAVIDTAAIEKSMVEIEIDVASINTGIKPRDEHLKNPDFFEVEKFPSATLTVKDVKGEGDSYSATATLSLHGLSKDFPVKFKIAEKRDDGSVIIEGTHEMSRSLFSIGGAPDKSGAADALSVQIRLHLKNT